MDPALAAVILVGNLVEAWTGFGSTLIAVVLGARLVPLGELVPLLIPLNILLSLWLVLRHRRGFAADLFWRRILPAAGLGVPVGVWLFGHLEGRWLLGLLGAFVVVVAAWQLVREFRRGHPRSPLRGEVATVWLFAGGLVQGMYAAGGPLVVYAAARLLPDPFRFRTTLSALWLVLNVAVAIGHLAGGSADLGTYLAAARYLPALVLGVVVGEWLHHRVPETWFRRGVYLLLVLAGGSVMVDVWQGG